MDIDNEIRSYMTRKGKSASQVAREIGTTPQNLNKKLANQSLKYKEAHEIAGHLGYEIVWKERESTKPPEQ
jgi:hypothetical protein